VSRRGVSVFVAVRDRVTPYAVRRARSPTTFTPVSSCGRAEARFALTPKTTLVGGGGIDKPSDAAGRVMRVQNRSLFGSAIVQFTPELAASIEYRWLETELGLAPVARRNNHVNAVFAVKF